MANGTKLIDLGRLNTFKQQLEARALTPAQVAQIMMELLQDYMTAAEVTQAIAALASTALKREIAAELPEIGAAGDNVIYMVPAADGEDGDVRDEFIAIGGAWEKIGSTRVDLTGYLTVDDLATDDDIDALFETEE